MTHNCREKNFITKRLLTASKYVGYSSEKTGVFKKSKQPGYAIKLNKKQTNKQNSQPLNHYRIDMDFFNQKE